jgi:hypothetical protein
MEAPHQVKAWARDLCMVVVGFHRAIWGFISDLLVVDHTQGEVVVDTKEEIDLGAGFPVTEEVMEAGGITQVGEATLIQDMEAQTINNLTGTCLTRRSCINHSRGERNMVQIASKTRYSPECFLWEGRTLISLSKLRPCY